MSNPLPLATVTIACFPPRETAADAELILERYATASQQISAAIRFLPANSDIRNPTSAIRRSRFADQRHRRHGAALRGLGPREFQIRLRARREPEPECPGGSPCLRQTHPRLGQRRRFPFAARCQKSRVVRTPVRPPSGSLSPTPATGARSKSNCAPKCSKAKTRRFFISAGRRPNAPAANNCPPTPTCA